MNKIKEIQTINQQELQRGLAGTSGSWHSNYAHSAWIYVGGLAKELTEGDLICVLSQYGEIQDIVLHRQTDTGQSQGFCHAKYEDARSCVLAVDNFCGIEICGRKIVVDHVETRRLPKHVLEAVDAEQAIQAGAAYKDQELASAYSLHQGQDLFAPPIESTKQSNQPNTTTTAVSRVEEKKRLRQEKKERKRERARIRAEREERRQRSKQSDRNDSDRKKKKKHKKDRV